MCPDYGHLAAQPCNLYPWKLGGGSLLIPGGPGLRAGPCFPVPPRADSVGSRAGRHLLSLASLFRT